MEKSLCYHLERKWKRYKLLIGEFPQYLSLALLQIPKRERNKGVGTRVLKDIRKYMDQRGKVLIVQPSDCFGSNLKRLKEFYSRFGFVQHPTSPKEMIRQPKRRTQWITTPIRKVNS